MSDRANHVLDLFEELRLINNNTALPQQHPAQNRGRRNARPQQNFRAENARPQQNTRAENRRPQNNTFQYSGLEAPRDGRARYNGRNSSGASHNLPRDINRDYKEKNRIHGRIPQGSNNRAINQHFKSVGSFENMPEAVRKFEQQPTNSQNHNRRRMNRNFSEDRLNRSGYKRNFSEETLDNDSDHRLTNNVRHKKQIGYKRLEELSSKEPVETLRVLANPQSGFDSLLKEKLRPDQILLLMKCISNVCNIEFEGNKAAVLTTVCQSDFMEQLMHFITSLPSERDKNRVRSINDFFENLFNFYKTVLTMLPINACDCLPRLFISTDLALQGIEQYQGFNMADKKEELKSLQSELKTCEEEKTKHLIEKKSRRYHVDEEPPDDFRELNLFPTVHDICGVRNDDMFVRANIIEGSYESVNHYLDVQFRLLREDFLRPLRDGINKYIEDNQKELKSKRINNVRIYQKSVFLGPVTIQNGIGQLVCFDPEKKMIDRINWENCRRFMFGSLICFTCDMFKSIFFATVMDRNLKDLKEGRIIVQWAEGMDVPQNIDKTEFIMVESEVFFEPYYYVMKALQKMDENTFPMKDYLVFVKPEYHVPNYIDNHTLYEVDGFRFRVAEPVSWPTQLDLKLDTSQYEAYKSALTREFVVIQGPPGTGKTFIGLMIAKTLLLNEKVWNVPKTPILVVCFTNHALDQFLEGLLPWTQNLIRVGGRSKCENLNSYNLRNQRRYVKRSRDSMFLFREKQDTLCRLLNDIKEIESFVNVIMKRQGIVSLKVLSSYGVCNHKLNCFMEDGEVEENSFIEWLKTGKDSFVVNDKAIAENTVGAGVDENMFENDEMEDVEETENRLDDNEMEFDVNKDIKMSSTKVVVNFEEIENNLNMLKGRIKNSKEILNENVLHNSKWTLEEMYRDQELMLKYFSAQLIDKKVDDRYVERLLAVENLWLLKPADRWILYRKWAESLKDIFIAKLRHLEVTFKAEKINYDEAKLMDDYEVLKEASVVGMTTTGAARLQPVLQALKCKIVLIEEAAEVMESHIVVSLTNHCQHLILIGDHQQLRPTTADYHLARNYMFDVSLFERMLKNGMHCEVLKVQHRMRPEISKLIVPAIYPVLHDHESVLKFEKIKGIENSIFFVSHNHLEEEVKDSSSRQNVYEAKFLIALCRYIIMQGYSPEQITVLATYSGQFFYLRNERRKHNLLRDVKMCVVDNFQGEENDIILLSLVRSNKEGNIGFLSIENRVCVALSRARKGFYIVGNMDILQEKSSLWKNIHDTLKKQNAIGTSLPIRCQIHNTYKEVQVAEDFLKYAPEGGCTLLCNILMNCGHKCHSVCHVQDRAHENMKCKQPCLRSPPDCQYAHECPKRCWEDCGSCMTQMMRILPCGHVKQLSCHVDYTKYRCHQLVDVTLPHCNHQVKKPCYADLNTFPCTVNCEDRLLCGHSCELKCHVLNDPDHLQYLCKKPCAKLNKDCMKDHMCEKRCHEPCISCTKLVTKQLACTHIYKMSCSKKPESVKCERPCKKTMACGHKCRLQCWETCGNCQEKVVKPTPGCQHPQTVKCCETPDPKQCRSPCSRMLPCYHQCRQLCRDVCGSKPCTVMVPSRVRPLCGHSVQIPCNMLQTGLQQDSEELLSYCRQPCGVLLKCEHRCLGTCGECMQGRMHMPCQEKCGKTLICGHSCDIPCAENCPPCNKKCTYKCMHSKCSQKCGEPCTPCREPCEWRCKHSRCSKLCFQPCNREACTEPCDKKLKCKHPCIGFCGDPCPPLCRICNKEEVTTVFLGFEEEEDARFVYLEDCKHSIESQGLEMWLERSESEISMKLCPLCKTPIRKTMRYINLIKDAYKDVVKVKEKVFGEKKDIEQSRNQLLETLKALNPALLQPYKIIAESTEFHQFFIKLYEWSQDVNKGRRNVLSTTDVETLTIRAQILSEVVTVVRKVYYNLPYKQQQATLGKYMDLILKVASRNADRITAQEVQDLNLELNRFQKLAQLCVIEASASFRASVAANLPDVKAVYGTVKDIIFCLKPFSNNENNATKVLLERLNKLLKTACIITDDERRDIVKAVGLRQGHWYKCPNGHPYVIANCGRPVQVGKCNECGANIGGSTKYQEVYNTIWNKAQPVLSGRRNVLSLLDLNDLQTKCEFLSNVVQEIKEITPKLGASLQERMLFRINNQHKTNLQEYIEERMNSILSLINKHDSKATKQRVEDINLEYLRFQRVLQLLLLEYIIRSNNRVLTPTTKGDYEVVKKVLYYVNRYTEEKDKVMKSKLESLNIALKGGLNITEKEKKEILAAIGVTPGHWFKCPNGHVYVITECGGAMQEGRCNECGAKIGGANHALLETNQLASEMDGARHAAWSNQQNLENYDLENMVWD